MNTMKSDMPRIMYFIPTCPFPFIPSAPSSVMNSVDSPVTTGSTKYGSAAARLVNQLRPPVAASNTKRSAYSPRGPSRRAFEPP